MDNIIYRERTINCAIYIYMCVCMYIYIAQIITLYIPVIYTYYKYMKSKYKIIRHLSIGKK